MKNKKTQEQLIAENFYEYIRMKVKIYLSDGFEKYRKADAFSQPSGTMTKDRLIRFISGCTQIIEKNKGLSPETPFEGLEIEGFYDLMALFHFKPIRQKIVKMKAKDYIVDEMECEHIITHIKMTLFNKVNLNISESKTTRISG